LYKLVRRKLLECKDQVPHAFLDLFQPLPLISDLLKLTHESPYLTHHLPPLLLFPLPLHFCSLHFVPYPPPMLLTPLTKIVPLFLVLTPLCLTSSGMPLCRRIHLLRYLLRLRRNLRKILLILSEPSLEHRQIVSGVLLQVLVGLISEVVSLLRSESPFVCHSAVEDVPGVFIGIEIL